MQRVYYKQYEIFPVPDSLSYSKQLSTI